MGLTEKSWNLIKKVPKGKIVTYKQIAKALKTNAYRSIGSAMRKNRSAGVPCHRVICSDGRVGNFNRGKSEKIRLLKKEGVEIRQGKIDLKKYAFRF